MAMADYHHDCLLTQQLGPHWQTHSQLAIGRREFVCGQFDSCCMRLKWICERDVTRVAKSRAMMQRWKHIVRRSLAQRSRPSSLLFTLNVCDDLSAKRNFSPYFLVVVVVVRVILLDQINHSLALNSNNVSACVWLVNLKWDKIELNRAEIVFRLYGWNFGWQTLWARTSIIAVEWVNKWKPRRWVD